MTLTGCAILNNTDEPEDVNDIVNVCSVPALTSYTLVPWEGGLLIPFDYIPEDNPDYVRYDVTLDKLEAYQGELIDDLLIHRAMLKELCDPDDEEDS